MDQLLVELDCPNSGTVDDVNNLRKKARSQGKAYKPHRLRLASKLR